MNRPRTWIWIGVAGCLIATLVVLGHFWSAGGIRADKGITGSPNGAPLALRWREGSSQQYAVRMDSSFRMNTTGAGAAQPGQSIAVRLDGILEFRTLEVGSSQVLVGMQLSSVALRVSGVSDPATDQALGMPFRVRFTPNGMPSAFEFPAGLAQDHRGVIENLVRTFQVAVQNEPAWVAQEPNLTGVYEATYAWNGPSRLGKAKRRFLAPAAADTVPEIASREFIRIDADRDWIAAMTVDETVRSGDSTGLAVDISNHASIELRPGPVAHTAAALAAWRFAASAAPKPGAGAQVPTTTLSRAQAEKQIRLDIAALDAAREGRHVWIHRLRDLVRSDERLPFTLLEAMRQQQLSDRTHADLYLVLELAGSPQSQAALRSVLDGDGWTPADSKRAIIALGGVAMPTTETIETLRSLSRGGDADSGRGELAGTATLALGSLGNRLITTKDDRYPTLRADLLNGALAGAGARQRADFVHALGNTGDASLAREIVPLLDDSEPAVRGATAQSLGRLGADAAADPLLARLGQERVGIVRGAIAEALVSWTSPTPAAVASIRVEIRGEREERARLAMAQILGRSLATYPENREVLQALLRSEQSERIRRQVAELLATGK